MSFRDQAVGDLVWIDNVRQRMLGVPERAYATYALTADLVKRGVEGCFIECGVFAGVHPAIMWRALNLYNMRSIAIHLFDSFEGIPHAGEHDTDDIAGELHKHGRDGALTSTGISSCSMDDVIAHMEEWGVDLGQLKFHPGWVENTVPPFAASISKVAMLRIDVDLYSATKVCLDHLLPKVSHGGYVVVDDMNLVGCRKAVSEFLDPKRFIEIDPHGAAYVRM